MINTTVVEVISAETSREWGKVIRAQTLVSQLKGIINSSVR